MNKTPGPRYWVSVMFLISSLLFQGVASAAMLCCGSSDSDHTEHHAATMTAEHHASASTDVQMDVHSHHMDKPQMGHEQQDMSSCPGCASGCTVAAIMINSLDSLSASVEQERIFIATELQIPLTTSGLERPPRFTS